MANNKVIFGNTTIMDITDTTAEEDSVVSGEVFYKKSGDRATGTASYAGSAVPNGVANQSEAIMYGVVDNTSTSTAYTATINGLSEYKDGTIIMLKNGVVTSSEQGFTININNLGAKPVYSNLSEITAETDIFNINYTMMFIYDETKIGGGCWVCYHGYDSSSDLNAGTNITINDSTISSKDTYMTAVVNASEQLCFSYEITQ